LKTVLLAVGFKHVVDAPVSQSFHLELVDVEQHWKSTGRWENFITSSCVEALK